MKSCEPSQELTVGKVGLHRLYRWRPSARFGCLGVFVFCGILSACPISLIFEAQMWEEPSIETRMKVNADLRSCTLKESELPNGWSKGWPMSLPLKGPDYPVPTGMIGGIFAPFSHQRPRTGMAASHELQLYERTFRATYKYKIRRIGFLSRWHRTWVPLDLSQANLSADQYRAACSDFVPDRGPRRGEKICEAKARYGKFISVFDADVSPRDISVEEFIQVLQTIDKRMIQCVDSFADKKWEEE